VPLGWSDLRHDPRPGRTLADTVTWTPLIVLLSVAAVLTGVGLATYDRRDIA
jgi:putative exporter of polyketide antibiotics